MAIRSKAPAIILGIGILLAAAGLAATARSVRAAAPVDVDVALVLAGHARADSAGGAGLPRCLGSRAWGGEVTAPLASNRWDAHFLRLALDNALMSKDPSTKVGAVIVGPDREVRAMGFNGFPRGIADTPERLSCREVKLDLVVHAEMNAVLNAARIGTPTKGCTMYLIASDASGAIWGGPPCARCAVEVIQAGITEIVSLPFKTVPSRWRASIERAGELLQEAGIRYREACEPVDPPPRAQKVAD